MDMQLAGKKMNRGCSLVYFVNLVIVAVIVKGERKVKVSLLRWPFSVSLLEQNARRDTLKVILL